MARVYSPEGKLLAAREIAQWANKVHKQAGGKKGIFSAVDFAHTTLDGGMKRLQGHMCGCGVTSNGFSNGEFVLLPLNDESVISGGKAYMQCKKCGELSHL